MNKCGTNRYKQLLLIDILFWMLIFNLLCFEIDGSHQTCFAHTSFCLTSSIFRKHLEFYRISHKPRRYLAIIINKFWYLCWATFDDIWRYLTIFDDIWRRKRSHLKPENRLSKNIVKYRHLSSSGNRALEVHMILYVLRCVSNIAIYRLVGMEL